MNFSGPLAVLLCFAQVSFAQVTGTDCDQLISKSSTPPVHELLHKVAKSDNDLKRVAQSVGSTESLMKQAALRGVDFKTFLQEAKAANIEISQQHEAYIERVYILRLIRTRCNGDQNDRWLEARITANRNKRHTIQPDTTTINQINDVMAGMGPAPNTNPAQTAPSEAGR